MKKIVGQATRNEESTNSSGVVVNQSDAYCLCTESVRYITAEDSQIFRWKCV